jgi:hypothetical protein
MAQYEQKTDSREFEVANPVANPDRSPGLWSTEQGGDATDIVVRLWGPQRPDRRTVPTWKTDSVLVYMIADLVGASRGRIAEESPAILGAHFDGSRQAIVAAKRIQTSVLEFLACRPSERVGAAILIYKPRTSDPTGFSTETVQQTLGQAKPGQILLAENISERLRDLPGVEFHPVPPLTTVMGDRQTELTELVWTTPEQIALLQGSVVDASEPRTVDGPAAGATVIVDSQMVDSRFARRERTGQAVPPVAGTADFVFKDGSETASRHVQHRAPTAEELSRGTSILQGLDELEERPLITRTRIIVGLVAVVLVAALIGVFHRPTHNSRLPIQLPQEQTATEGSDKGTTATPEPEAKTPRPESETVKPAANVPAVVAKPRPPAKASVDNRGKNKKDNSVEPEIVEESGGLSQNDIPGLLGMAVKDTGDGRYPEARREYRKVLKLQPNNLEAKDGLRKLDLIQNDQH